MKNLDFVDKIENGEIYLKTDFGGDIFNILRKGLEDLRQDVVQEALKYIGYPSIKYKTPEAGMNEPEFDCSGFITFILRKFGLVRADIRHSNEYFDSYGVNIHQEMMKPGDLIFFSKDGLVPRHIGILLSDTQYIHAPGKDNTKVEIKNIISEKIEKNIPFKIYAQNPIGFKRIVLGINNESFSYDGNITKRRNKIV